MSEKKIRVTVEVEPPTYEQVVAYLLSKGWKKTYTTTPEWEAKHGVIVNVWVSKKNRYRRYEVRIQYDSKNPIDSESVQIEHLISYLASLDNVPEYDIWLDIVLLNRPEIESA